eukprot:SAG11_NODE_2565_length_3217_cov_3.113534_2_plen_151_part_00
MKSTPPFPMPPPGVLLGNNSVPAIPRFYGGQQMPAAFGNPNASSPRHGKGGKDRGKCKGGNGEHGRRGGRSGGSKGRKGNGRRQQGKGGGKGGGKAGRELTAAVDGERLFKRTMIEDPWEPLIAQVTAALVCCCALVVHHGTCCSRQRSY